MSATEAPFITPTSEIAPIRGLKLPPPEPPKFSLTIKIFLAAALLILIAVGGAIAISAYRAHDVADRKIEEDLKKSGPSWDSFQSTRYGELQKTLAVVVNNAGIIGLMAQPDPPTVFEALKKDQASSAHADFMIAVDPEGIAFARTDKPLPYAVDLRGVPTIKAALDGSSKEGIWLSGGRLFHVVAAPVLEGGQSLKGVIAAGWQINDDVARSVKRLINTDVVFLADQANPKEPAKAAVVASTMQELSGAVLGSIEQQSGLVQMVLREGKTIGPLKLDVSGKTYLAYLLPIRSSTDQLVGAAVALRSRDEELAAFRQIQNTQFLVGLAALAVAFVLSFIFARRITGPVSRLVEATEAVRVGNLEAADLPVESKDEIGILARSFKAMLEELKEKEALEKYVASLTMTVGADAQTLVAGRLSTGAPSVPRGAEPQVGQVFALRYEIQSVLGKGGMGIVYKAHDRDLDDLVAIKTLRGEALSADPTLLDRFKQEIRLARRITHPNILRTHDLGETGGLRYLSMEFVKGITLKHLVESGQILPTPVALRIAKQICAGPRRGARGRRHPPRHQAPEHPDRADGRPEDHGLRHRAAHPGPRHDGDGHGRRHAGLHVSRAGPRRGARLPLRHLLDGRRPLRDLHGLASFRRRLSPGRRPEARPGEAARAADREPAHRPQDRGDRLEVHGEGSRAALPDSQRALRGADEGHRVGHLGS